jgi:excisionase family DNA binding protein
MDKLLTAKEASQALRIHVNTLHKYLGNGQLKGFKVGGTRYSRWRITAADLRNFLQNGS